MNYLLKTKQFKLSFIAVLLTAFNAGAFANTVSIDLHNKSTAATSYQNFKSGSGTDPFNTLDKGYREKYVDTVIGSAYSEKQALVSRFSDNSEYNITEKVSSQAYTEKDALRRMYNTHFDSKGNFDALSYAISYKAFMDTKKDARNVLMDNVTLGVVSTINESSALISTYRSSSKLEVSTAQANLIDVMNSSSYSKKSDLSTFMVEAASRLATMPDTANNAEILARRYADCGFACSFPVISTPPVAPVTAPPPVTPPETTPIGPDPTWDSGADPCIIHDDRREFKYIPKYFEC